MTTCLLQKLPNKRPGELSQTYMCQKEMLEGLKLLCSLHPPNSRNLPVAVEMAAAKGLMVLTKVTILMMGMAQYHLSCLLSALVLRSHDNISIRWLRAQMKFASDFITVSRAGPVTLLPRSPHKMSTIIITLATPTSVSGLMSRTCNRREARSECRY